MLIAAIGAFLGWRQLQRRKADVEQTMTNSRGGSQRVASRDGAQVKQTMTDSTDGDQQA